MKKPINDGMLGMRCAEPGRLKIGDLVRVIFKDDTFYKAVGIITKSSNPYAWKVCFGDYFGLYNNDELQLITGKDSGNLTNTKNKSVASTKGVKVDNIEDLPKELLTLTRKIIHR